jgi:RNA polymerase sigma factor (sigma-70 family)
LKLAHQNYAEENTLVTALRNRERGALEYLYDSYSGALYGVILRIVKLELSAEEVLQDVFVKIHDRIENYDANKGRLFTWMVNIARNQAIDKVRSKEINQERKTVGIENSVNTVNEGTCEQSIESIGITQLLSSLPDDQRVIIEFLYLKGYTQAEVSEALALPLGTVKTRVRLAMQRLRTIFGIT